MAGENIKPRTLLVQNSRNETTMGSKRIWRRCAPPPPHSTPPPKTHARTHTESCAHTRTNTRQHCFKVSSQVAAPPQRRHPRRHALGPGQVPDVRGGCGHRNAQVVVILHVSGKGEVEYQVIPGGSTATTTATTMARGERWQKQIAMCCCRGEGGGVLLILLAPKTRGRRRRRRQRQRRWRQHADV
jgi:hypothetical protein